MATKPITNQRTKTEIREEVSKIDKEVPDTKEFVEIMENKPQNNPEETELEIEDTAISSESDENEEIPTDTPQEDVETEEIEEEDEAEDPKKPVKPSLPDPETRARESGQEAMILHSKNRKIMETIEEAVTLPEPTLEELTAYAKEMGEDYEDLDNFAKNVLKESLMNKRSLSKISGLVEEEKQVSKWVKKVEDFLEEETTQQSYEALAGREEDFLKYASKKSHIGSDLDLLVAGFLWKNPVKKHKGSILLPSGRAPSGLPVNKKPTEPTEDDARVIRMSDPKKYKRMIKNRKFKTTI